LPGSHANKGELLNGARSARGFPLHTKRLCENDISAAKVTKTERSVEAPEAIQAANFAANGLPRPRQKNLRKAQKSPSGDLPSVHASKHQITPDIPYLPQTHQASLRY